jgi:hypothetical protein
MMATTTPVENTREFNGLDDIKCWSLELLPMTAWMRFVHKFKNLLAFLPISYEERMKEVFFESGGRINIHCKTMGSKP